MKTATATESEIQREGVRAILLKAGIDPERAVRVRDGYTMQGERYWVWRESE